MNTTTVVSNTNKPIVMHWGAITAGFVVAVVVGMLFNLLGVGLGFISLPLYKGALTALSVSAIVWYVLSGSLAMYAGGWTAGFFSHTCKRRESLLYGVITWALATIVGSVLSLWGAGALVGGVASLATTSLRAFSSQSIEMIAKPAMQLASENEKVITSTIQQQIDALFESSSKNSSVGMAYKEGASISKRSREVLKQLSHNNTRLQLMYEIQKWMRADDKSSAGKAKERVSQFLARHTDLSEEEVQQVIADWQAYYQNMKKIASEKVEDAKKEATAALEKGSMAMGSLALALFAVLLLGSFAAAYGSLLGAKAQCSDHFVDMNSRL